MGRELRRVPPGWEHPREETGHHHPLLDESFEEAWEEWHTDLHLWEDGRHSAQQRDAPNPEFYEPTPLAFVGWIGASPDPEDYRPNWSVEERTHYQVYETVSEGTPISPVFSTKEGIVDWWVNVGDSFNGRLTRDQAEKWVEYEGSPTMVVTSAGLIPGAQFVGETK